MKLARGQLPPRYRRSDSFMRWLAGFSGALSTQRRIEEDLSSRSEVEDRRVRV